MKRETITKKPHTRTAWSWSVIAVGALVAACGFTLLFDSAGLATQGRPTRLVSLRAATLDVPIVIPQIGARAENYEAAKQVAETMASAPITLTYHDKQWTLTPEQIASFLDFRSTEVNGLPFLVPYIAQGRMWLYLLSLEPDVRKAPVDAKFASDDGATLRVIPSVSGERLDQTATVKALNAVALRPTNRTLEVAVTITEPDFTTTGAEATHFDQLSTFTTKFVGTANRRVNVRITTKYATNVFLAPGQEYDFDKQIGPRTSARGYKLAPGIVGPNQLEDVLGGGICQVSTTTFNAVFFAGLKVTERHNHSIYISHYPKGRDATVSHGTKNFRFVNDTDHYIWIRGSSDGITTTISIYGTYDGRKVSYAVGNFYNVRSPSTITVMDPTLPVGKTKVVNSGQTGKSVKTTRLVTAADGSVLHNDTWISTWAMFPKTVVVGTKPSTPPTTAPPTTTTT